MDTPKMDIPKLEELARELETLQREDITELISHVRNDSYEKSLLVKELLDANLKFFAVKLLDDYYEKNYEAFSESLANQPEPEAPTENTEPGQEQMTTQAKDEAELPSEPAQEEPKVDDSPAQSPTDELPECVKCVEGLADDIAQHAYMTKQHPFTRAEGRIQLNPGEPVEDVTPQPTVENNVTETPPSDTPAQPENPEEPAMDQPETPPTENPKQEEEKKDAGPEAAE